MVQTKSVSLRVLGLGFGEMSYPEKGILTYEEFPREPEVTHFT